MMNISRTWPARCAAAAVAVSSAALAASLLPGLATPALAICPINDPTCGVPPPPPPPLPTPTPTPNRAVFSAALEQLTAVGGVPAGQGPVAEANVDHVNEAPTSPVSLNGCGSTATSGIRSYQWTVNGAPLTAVGCAVTWQRPLSHAPASAVVNLTIVPVSGAPFSVSQTVAYRDVVIASLGDSAASGEGAPERIGMSKPSFEVSEDCDRSGWAASAQAALQVQQALGPGTTVHFWHLACSGASITWDDSGPWTSDPYNAGGILDPFDGTGNDVYLEPQLQRLEELRAQAANLPVDRLLITAGANDVHWADVLEKCLPLGIFGSSSQTNCVNSYTAKVGPQGSMGTLPAHFRKLNTALTSSGVAGNNIYLTQYFDPIDSLSAQPSGCPGEPLAWPNMRKWGVHQIEDPLQDDVQTAATTYGWHFIGGIRQAFQGHGVCDKDSWVDSLEASVADQDDTNGTWHANRAGQLVIASIIYSNIIPGL
jgi:hypothetical protein